MIVVSRQIHSFIPSSVYPFFLSHNVIIQMLVRAMVHAIAAIGAILGVCAACVRQSASFFCARVYYNAALLFSLSTDERGVVVVASRYVVVMMKLWCGPVSQCAPWNHGMCVHVCSVVRALSVLPLMIAWCCLVCVCVGLGDCVGLCRTCVVCVARALSVVVCVALGDCVCVARHGTSWS